MKWPLANSRAPTPRAWPMCPVSVLDEITALLVANTPSCPTNNVIALGLTRWKTQDIQKLTNFNPSVKTL